MPVKSININSRSITMASLQHNAKSSSIQEHGERINHFIYYCYTIKGKNLSAVDEGCGSRGQGQQSFAQKRLSYSEGRATKQHELKEEKGRDRG